MTARDDLIEIIEGTGFEWDVGGATPESIADAILAAGWIDCKALSDMVRQWRRTIDASHENLLERGLDGGMRARLESFHDAYTAVLDLIDKAMT